MGKNIAIKLAIVLVILALGYSAFWFFKTGQTQKHVNNFISENSSHISAQAVEVSGFPISQKITITNLKFTVPGQSGGKRQIIVKNFQASAGIFSADFVGKIVDKVSIQDDTNNLDVEFAKDPEIKITIADHGIAKFSYKDFGHKVLSADKTVVYSSEGSFINIDSIFGENDKIITKITADVKNISNFGVVDIYKNILEKKIIEGIKTGEITIGSAQVSPTSDVSSVLISAAEAAKAAAANSVMSAVGVVIPMPATDPATIAPPAVVPATAAIPSVPSATAPVAANPSLSVVATDPVVVANPAAAVQNPAQAANAPAIAPIADGQVAAAPAPAIPAQGEIKNNFSMNIEYILTPTQGEQQPITDPTQIREATVQYSKVTKINNLEFSNSLYKIVVNGEVNSFQDDSKLSGSISINIEKFEALANEISVAFVKMADLQKPASPTDAAVPEVVTAQVPTANSYSNFLQKVSLNLGNVSKELATKNILSKDGNATFDVRREKNMDFLVNETSAREILGKF